MNLPRTRPSALFAVVVSLLAAPTTSYGQATGDEGEERTLESFTLVSYLGQPLPALDGVTERQIVNGWIEVKDGWAAYRLTTVPTSEGSEGDTLILVQPARFTVEEAPEREGDLVTYGVFGSEQTGLLRGDTLLFVDPAFHATFTRGRADIPTVVQAFDLTLVDDEPLAPEGSNDATSTQVLSGWLHQYDDGSWTYMTRMVPPGPIVPEAEFVMGEGLTLDAASEGAGFTELEFTTVSATEVTGRQDATGVTLHITDFGETHSYHFQPRR